MSAQVKSREVNPFPQGRKNQDLLQRLNHLYQANTYLASLSRELGGAKQLAHVGQRAHSEPEEGREKNKKGRGKRSLAKDDALGVVARRSNQRFKVMVKHNVLATDPTLKRSFCKGCNSICIPGLNARVRVKPSKIHGNKIITTCLTCSTTRTIPAPPIQSEVAQPDPVTASDITPKDSTALVGGIDSALSISAFIIPPQSHSTSPPSTSNISPQTAIRPLDGVNRSAKRQRLSKKAQFWRKEAIISDSKIKTPAQSDGPTLNNPAASKPEANTTSQATDPPPADNANKVANTPIQVQTPTSTAEGQPGPPKQKQQKGQKQKGKNAGKGGNPAAQPLKQNGHLLWRGDELVTGWGDPVLPQHPTSAFT